MKNLLLFALVLTALSTKAQNENKSIIPVCDTIERTIQTENPIVVNMPQRNLQPVYFNFRKRLLLDKYKNRIQPLEFLDLCRTINDSAIQQQVARFDGFTKDKANLGLAALGSGATAFALLGSVAVYSEQHNTNATAGFAFFGVIAAISIPAIAIYTSVPHQKRKTVLFRDLPVAYNQYVESLNQ